MATDQGRLQQIYGEMGDAHLLDMADDMEDLTDEGRMVLTEELRRRGLIAPAPAKGTLAPVEEPERETGFSAGIPGIFPASAAVMEQALEAAQTSRDGMSSLIVFYDGIELSKACAILDEAELDPVIEPIEGDALTGVPARFEVWVEDNDIEQAKSLLRQKMGLFPAAEVEENVAMEAATGLVGIFESSAQAEEARSILDRAGIGASVVKGTDDNGHAVSWELVVDPEEQERALTLVAKEMNLDRTEAT